MEAKIDRTPSEKFGGITHLASLIREATNSEIGQEKSEAKLTSCWFPIHLSYHMDKWTRIQIDLENFQNTIYFAIGKWS